MREREVFAEYFLQQWHEAILDHGAELRPVGARLAVQEDENGIRHGEYSTED